MWGILEKWFNDFHVKIVQFIYYLLNFTVQGSNRKLHRYKIRKTAERSFQDYKKTCMEKGV